MKIFGISVGFRGVVAGALVVRQSAMSCASLQERDLGHRSCQDWATTVAKSQSDRIRLLGQQTTVEPFKKQHFAMPTITITIFGTIAMG